MPHTASAGDVQAVTLRGQRTLALERFPRPAVGPNDLLVRVERAGVCGTDVEIYNGLLSEFPLPLILGHEIVGDVQEIGEEAARMRSLRVGDRVIVEASLSCGECGFCRRGENRHCPNAGSYGLRSPCNRPPYLWGGLAEVVFVPAGATLHRIPPGVTLDTAVLITSVIANGIQWVTRLGGCRMGDSVVVQGTGPQGLACAAAASRSGAQHVIVTGLARDRGRLAQAARFGATHTLVADECELVEEVARLTGGRLADLVVDVTGSPRSPQVSLDLVRTGGTIVHASQMGTQVPSALFLDTLVRKEATIRGALSKGADAVRVALEVAAQGLFPFDQIITHRYPLADFQLAFDQLTAQGERPLKAVFEPTLDRARKESRN